jgi:hypothetical protein
MVRCRRGDGCRRVSDGVAGADASLRRAVNLGAVTPSGLYLRDVQANRPEEAAAGQIKRIGRMLGEPIRPQEDVYTGVGEAAGVQLISAFLEDQRVRTMVANSHYLGPNDLIGKNLVDRAGPGSLRNPHPLPGKPEVYPRSGGHHEGVLSFARISIWPSSSPEQRIMIVSGRETWSTEGAVRFLIRERTQREWQERIDEDPPEGARGVKSEHLEIVVEVEGMSNRAVRAVYVTDRYLRVTLPLCFR